MLEHLFGSKTRLKLLRIFFRDPTRFFYIRELTRLLDVQINAVRRELELLVKAGLVKKVQVKAKDNEQASSRLRKYYQVDESSPLYSELQALIIKAQILGQQDFVKEIQHKAGKVKLLLLTGRFTNDKRAPSDLLLVGKIKERSVAHLISSYEREFGFDIRYTTMSEEEFFDRRQVMDKFLFSLFEADNMKIVNDLKV